MYFWLCWPIELLYPILASSLHPLHVPLQAGQPWKWSKDCDAVFKQAKNIWYTAPVLAHYDPKFLLCLAGDASGVGAVLSHVFPQSNPFPMHPRL